MPRLTDEQLRGAMVYRDTCISVNGKLISVLDLATDLLEARAALRASEAAVQRVEALELKWRKRYAGRPLTPHEVERRDATSWCADELAAALTSQEGHSNPASAALSFVKSEAGKL